jgi:ABC-type multidrug transport system ATPase subunit
VAPAVMEAPDTPFQPLALVWRDIHYFVPMPAAAEGKNGGKSQSAAKAELELLKGVTGYARPSSLTALMGGSGAGKTTFMDVLAGRKTVGRITGDILINGRPKEQSTWARVCGYVEQTDIHMPRLTVRESLEFSAALRLDPIAFDARQVIANVARVMDMVDLHPIADRLVGEPGGEGLSLEQRKRLTIGVELVANPGVIFMDEPTSGLDAKAAATVIRAVRTIANSGRTVMVTIHQPSIEIFEAFDQLLLLHRGGYVNYFGPIGDRSADLIAHLSGYTGVVPVPTGYNPATWMLEITGGAPQTMIPAAPVDFTAEWPRSQLAAKTATECEALVADGLANAAAVSVSGGTFARGRAAQTWLLLCRFAREYWRNPAYNLTRLVMAVLQGILFGGIYYGQGNIGASDTPDVSTVFNVIGLSYTASLFSGMAGVMTAIPVVSTGRAVFYRERAVSMYGVLPYATASGLIELPFLLVQICVLFVPIIYFMVQFEADVVMFLSFTAMFFVSGATFTFFGQFLVFLTPNDLMALLLAGAFMFFWNIFSGFGIPVKQMPAYLEWVSYVSPTSYIIQGLCSIILGNSEVVIDAFGKPQTISQFLVDYFDYEYDFRYACVGIVAGFCLLFILTGSLALKFLNFNIR